MPAMAPDSETETFHPHDTLGNTATTTMQTTLCGAIFAAVQNTLRKQNVGAMGVFTHSGQMIATYAGVGLAYQFTRDSAANLRGKNDTYNDAIGGFIGGSVLGLSKRSIPFMLGAGAVTSIGVAAFSFTGGLTGNKDRVNDDDGDVERREAMKKLRRRSAAETVEQLGESREITLPGYEERRRQRLLEKYGVDVFAAEEAAKQAK